MVESNYDYLANNVLANLGFEHVLDDALRSKMKLGLPEFNLKAQEPRENGSIFEVQNFVKKDEMYFLNGPVKVTTFDKEGKEMAAEFPLFNQKGMNLDEMKRVMEGGTVYREYINRNQERVGRVNYLVKDNVNKDGITMLRSSPIDKMQVLREISKLPGLNISQRDKDELLLSVLSGNREALQLRNADGTRERMGIELSRQGMINVYNSKGEAVRMSKSSIQVLGEEKTEQKLPEMAKAVMAAQLDDQNQTKSARKKV